MEHKLKTNWRNDWQNKMDDTAWLGQTRHFFLYYGYFEFTRNFGKIDNKYLRKLFIKKHFLLDASLMLVAADDARWSTFRLRTGHVGFDGAIQERTQLQRSSNRKGSPDAAATRPV